MIPARRNARATRPARTGADAVEPEPTFLAGPGGGGLLRTPARTLMLFMTRIVEAHSVQAKRRNPGVEPQDSWSTSGDPARPAGAVDQLGPGGHRELAEEVVHVEFDGRL